MRRFGQVALVAVALLLRAEPEKAAFIPPEGLYAVALHTFDLVRSGVAVKDDAIGLRHPASHMSDALLAGTGEHRDLTGGWYNAADYGK